MSHIITVATDETFITLGFKCYYVWTFITLGSSYRPIRLTQCCTHSNLPGIRFFVYCICIIMWHSHLNDMELPETKRFIPKGFELGTTLSQPNRSITLVPSTSSTDKKSGSLKRIWLRGNHTFNLPWWHFQGRHIFPYFLPYLRPRYVSFIPVKSENCG